MKKEPVLVVMAAGMGSRYGGLKQMDRITEAGEIILDFSLYDAFMAGFKKAVLIIKEENEADFRDLLDKGAGAYMDIRYAHQKLDDIPEGYSIPEGRVKPWGTGHAVMSARHLVDGPFAVINADDYYGPSAFLSIYDFLENDSGDMAMVAYRVENTVTENGHVARGVCSVDERGYLRDITERTKIMRSGTGICFEEDGQLSRIPEGTPVSMNFWGFDGGFMKELEDRFPRFLDENSRSEHPEKGEYFLPAVADQLIKEGKARVKVLSTSDRWYGVTYKEDKEGVTAALQSMKDRGEYPPRLWATPDNKGRNAL